MVDHVGDAAPSGFDDIDSRNNTTSAVRDSSASVPDIDSRNAASAVRDGSASVPDIDSRNAASAFGGRIGLEP